MLMEPIKLLMQTGLRNTEDTMLSVLSTPRPATEDPVSSLIAEAAGRRGSTLRSKAGPLLFQGVRTRILAAATVIYKGEVGFSYTREVN